ncbi:MAG: hypothetical protein E3J23_08575 [Candidatus Stahlbacteria bacterium]|nr:MAG: hypothetical protein E3J23_08575 [Candidatus Stahlbacteria bacterium]
MSLYGDNIQKEIKEPLEKVTEFWQKNKTYFFGDRVNWEGKERILIIGSSIGVPPSELYLIWKKYEE